MLREAAAMAAPRAELLDILGWDDAMLSRVCAKHGIDIPVHRPAPSPSTPPPRSQAEPESFVGLSLEEIIAALPQRQSEILGYLARQPPAAFASSAVASRDLDREPDKINITIQAIDRKLRVRRASFRIEAKRGPRGGFRLRDTRENAP